MKLNKLVLKFVSISFSILVMLLVVIGLIKLGSFCYDFGYRVFTEGPVEDVYKRQTLQGIGLKKADLEGTISFSFCVNTTEAEIDYAIEQLKEIIPFRRKFTRH